MENNYLFSEYTETNNYAKANFTIFITWVTFYITVNYVGMGWLIDKMIGKRVTDVNPGVAVIIFFMSQTITSVIACFITLNYFKRANKRIEEIISSQPVEIATGKNLFKPKSAMPIKFYTGAILLFMQGIIIMLGLWITFLVIVVNQKYPQTTNSHLDPKLTSQVELPMRY